MRTRLALAVMWVALFAPSIPALSLEELVARHIEARGGLEKLRAIQTMRLTGKLVFAGGGFELAYSELLKRPGLARARYTAQGLTAVQAWDGKEGWQIAPFQGRKDPERQSRDDSKGLIDDADIDGPLRGHTVERLNPGVSRNRGRGRDRGAQNQSDAARRRHADCLPRPRLLPRHPRAIPAQSARGREPAGGRLRQLRARERCRHSLLV